MLDIKFNTTLKEKNVYIVADLRPLSPGGTRNNSSGLKVGHIDLRVADLDRAVRFYTEVIGLSVIYCAETIGHSSDYLAFDEHTHHLDLTWFYIAEDSSEDAYSSGWNHFAIVYPDDELLARAVTRLVDGGHRIDGARNRGGRFSICVRDPDGNELGLYHAGSGAKDLDPAEDAAASSAHFDVKRWLDEFPAQPAFAFATS